jgi:monoamine oxidase
MSELPLVVVVGAGVAGLSCAKALVDRQPAQCRVRVVEANAWVGGRVRQMEVPDIFPGTKLEVGAEFIHGGTTILHDLARLKGWPLKQIFTWAQGDGGPDDESAPDGGAGYYYFGGDHDGQRLVRFNEKDNDKEFAQTNELLADIAELPTTDEGGYSVPPARAEAVAAATAAASPGNEGGVSENMSLKTYLGEVEQLSPRMLGMAEAGYANTFGASLRDLSLQQCIDVQAMWDEDGDYDFRLNPTFKPLIDTLSEPQLPGRELPIAINAPVSLIDATSAGLDCLKVVMESGEEILADAVVVTASVPVLRDAQELRFTPSLPADKLQALQDIQSGNALKLILKFDKRVWPKDLHGVICTDCTVPEIWVRGVGADVDGHGRPLNPSQRECSTSEDGSDSKDDCFVVVGFAMGDFALGLQKLGEEQAIEAMLSQMDGMFGEVQGDMRCAHEACVGGMMVRTIQCHSVWCLKSDSTWPLCCRS